MVKPMGMMTVCFMALYVVTSMNRVNATDCERVLSSIIPCSSYLRNYFPISPGAQCCDGLGSVVESSIDTKSLCQCFRLHPLASGFIPSKVQQLPNLCKISSFLPLVNCLIPSANNIIPFPPLRFPFPPVRQSPTFPVPRISNPPVVAGPPAAA